MLNNIIRVLWFNFRKKLVAINNLLIGYNAETDQLNQCIRINSLNLLMNTVESYSNMN